MGVQFVLCTHYITSRDRVCITHSYLCLSTLSYGEKKSVPSCVGWALSSQLQFVFCQLDSHSELPNEIFLFQARIHHRHSRGGTPCCIEPQLGCYFRLSSIYQHLMDPYWNYFLELPPPIKNVNIFCIFFCCFFMDVTLQSM